MEDAKKNARNDADSTDPSSLFTKSELKMLQTFFKDKIMIKADMKDSLKVLSDLFKDLNLPPLLERRIIESFLYANDTVSTTKLWMLRHLQDGPSNFSLTLVLTHLCTI